MLWYCAYASHLSGGQTKLKIGGSLQVSSLQSDFANCKNMPQADGGWAFTLLDETYQVLTDFKEACLMESSSLLDYLLVYVVYVASLMCWHRWCREQHLTKCHESSQEYLLCIKGPWNHACCPSSPYTGEMLGPKKTKKLFNGARASPSTFLPTKIFKACRGFAKNRVQQLRFWTSYDRQLIALSQT